MSKWRRKALESFPELSRELASDDVRSTYDAWSEVFLPLTEKAHASGDEALLSRIFSYAAWSARQPAQAVWNAVAVSFYEHLFTASRADAWMECVAKHTPNEVARDMWSLWEEQLPASDLARLRAQLSIKR